MGPAADAAPAAQQPASPDAPLASDQAAAAPAEALTSTRPSSAAGSGTAAANSLRSMPGRAPPPPPQISTPLAAPSLLAGEPQIPTYDQGLPTELFAQLTKFDDPLIEVLRRGDIRLLRVVWLLAQPPDFRIMYRQQLEELEAQGASPSPLLSPEEAVSLVQRGDRSVGALTYGWLSPGEATCPNACAHMHVLCSSIPRAPVISHTSSILRSVRRQVILILQASECSSCDPLSLSCSTYKGSFGSACLPLRQTIIGHLLA